MNTQRPCGRMSKITENWLNTAVFGHMKHYDRSNVAPTESHKMSEHNIFLLQPFEHQQICKPTYKTGYRRSAYSEVFATHYITFQDINFRPYFKLACEKSVLWPALISNIVNVSLSGGSCYWIACNNFKPYCTLPHCELHYTYLWANCAALKQWYP